MWSAVCLFITIAFQSYSSINAAALPKVEKYGIVLDAGSSGTRIKVYKYIVGRHSPLAPSDVEQVKVPRPDKVKPGLSTFGNQVAMIQGYLRKLIENTKKVIPVPQQPSTPIMLFATAGMRLLPKNQQSLILNEVERLFSDKSFCPFLYRSGDARIISGIEEAVFGWITLNFLKGRLSPNVTGTLGALDLGGGSTQNAYRTCDKGSGKPTVEVKLAGKIYPLFVQSYLGYGLNEATSSYYKYLEDNSNNKPVVTSPCHNKGYSKAIQTSNSQHTQIVINGNYNEVKCQHLLKKKFFCNGNVTSCPMTKQPKLKGTFFGLNAFYYVMKDGGVIQNHGDIASLFKFKLLSHQLCSLPSGSLDTNLYKVQDLCFRLNYVYELFKDGYHVNFTNFVLHVSQKMSNFDLSWALGALIHTFKIL